VKEKPNLWLVIVFMAVFALTRWPGLLPQNFSAAYALVFCMGAFSKSSRALGGTFGVLLATDLLLNCYYQFVKGWDVFTPSALVYVAINYLGYGVLWGLGRGFGRRARDSEKGAGRLTVTAKPWLHLLGGGLLGATLFYLITNTASWLLNPFGNPEYTKDVAGWITALTSGTKGHPPTWEFFRNTLLSGGLFTGLFAAAMRWSEKMEAQEADAAEEEADEQSEGAQTEESGA